MKKICRMAVVCILLCSLILPIPVHARESDVQTEPRMSSIRDYTLLVGAPVYTVASCTVELGSVTMQGSGSSSSADLRWETEMPEGAIVYSIKIV